MKKTLISFCAAAAASLCLCTVFAVPAAAAPTEVVGGAPGSEETESSSGDTGVSSQKSAESAGLVPALPIETKAPEAEKPETKAPETKASEVKAPETEAPKAETPKTEAPKAEAPKSETSSVTNEAPKAETTAAAAPSSETKSAFAAEAPRPDEPEPEPAPQKTTDPEPAPQKTAEPEPAPQKTAEPEPAPQSTPEPAQQTGRQTPAAGDPKPNSYETLTDEELEALDRVTGPGVAKVQGGSAYGVNEPTVSDIKTSGAAPATDWSRVSATRKDIVDLAKTFIGGTYVYGGDSPEEGFDCSGLILYVYKEAAGIDLYHQSAVQASKGRAVSIAEMQPGDIIAYDGSPKDGIVNHVSIYAGDGKAIHAVGTGKGIRMTAFDYAAPLTIRNLLD